MEDFGIYHYRGEEIKLLFDSNGQQVVAKLGDTEVGLGSFNFDYKEDLNYLIDKKLDYIKKIKDNGNLMWFNNSGYRDIKLECQKRIIKVWTVNGNLENLENIISEAEEILDNYN